MVKELNKLNNSNSKSMCIQLEVNINNKTLEENIELMREKVDKIIDTELLKFYTFMKKDINIVKILTYTAVEAKLMVEAEQIKSEFEKQLIEKYNNNKKVEHLSKKVGH